MSVGKVVMKNNNSITNETISKNLPYIEPCIEFHRWLNYIPIFEKNYKNKLTTLDINKLTIQDYCLLYKYNEQDYYRQLFDKLITNKKLTNQEILLIINYMNNNSITDLMIQKLTKKELKYCNRQIKILSSISKDKLSNYILKYDMYNNLDNYLKLNIYDSYIYHKIIELCIENKLIEEKTEDRKKLHLT